MGNKQALSFMRNISRNCQETKIRWFICLFLDYPAISTSLNLNLYFPLSKEAFKSLSQRDHSILRNKKVKAGKIVPRLRCLLCKPLIWFYHPITGVTHVLAPSSVVPTACNNACFSEYHQEGSTDSIT